VFYLDCPCSGLYEVRRTERAHAVLPMSLVASSLLRTCQNPTTFTHPNRDCDVRKEKTVSPRSNVREIYRRPGHYVSWFDRLTVADKKMSAIKVRQSMTRGFAQAENVQSRTY